MFAYLQPGVDGEGPSCGIHAGHVLRVVDLFQRQLLSVVPMMVVHVLSHERVRLHREVLVHLHTVNDTLHLVFHLCFLLRINDKAILQNKDGKNESN